ncbi:hypothetical protein [Sphingopyxis sp. KK2]|uniref:beta family protein n=1 Tax=Sphingopyxis sp. KK2 TaxID=1855727 RepID=UPI001181A507|nr:hypothetical protein [Sphingopyxis sp. KK2]
MALREWNQIPYLPMLSLRPAEMRALEELPNLTKDRLLPIVQLRPWVGAHRLENATDRIREAYGERPVIVAMGEREPPNERPVHAQLEELRGPAFGFRAWCEFFRAHENYIPAIQYSPSIADEEAQIAELYALDRGLVVIIEPPAFPAIGVIAARVGARTEGGQGVCFVLDFGFAGRDHLEVAARATGYINTIRASAAAAFVSLSASSFPDNFVGLSDQPIYERRLFDTMPALGNLIYGDRGSARVERQSGGGGLPAPRIDYPMFDAWNFYRSDTITGFPGYRIQAERLIATEAEGVWNPRLRVWGTQMIERTAAGDMSAIGSPQKATAARINLHLQRQAFYYDPGSAEDTDEDWSG